MMAVPGAAAEIIPESEMAAVVGLELSQTIDLLLRGVPLASVGVALARCDWPATSEDDGRLTETAATGLRSTSIVLVPLDEHAEAA